MYASWQWWYELSPKTKHRFVAPMIELFWTWPLRWLTHLTLDEMTTIFQLDGLEPNWRPPITEPKLTLFIDAYVLMYNTSKTFLFVSYFKFHSCVINMVVFGHLHIIIYWECYRYPGVTRKSITRWCLCCYVSSFLLSPWWRHQMESFSALLDLCEGNSPVIGGFPSQSPETRSIYVFFDLRQDKWLSKQSRRRWFETPLRSL